MNTTEHNPHILPCWGLGNGIPRAQEGWPRIGLLDDVRGNQFSAVVWRPAAEWTGVTPQVTPPVTPPVAPPVTDQVSDQVTVQVAGEFSRLQKYHLTATGQAWLQQQNNKG